MAKSRKRAKILETRYFGILIGVLMIGLFLLIDRRTSLLDNLNLKMIDVNFAYKNVANKQNIQEGVSVQQRNSKISQDLLIIGIDFRSLDTFGKWPFPRFRHANLIDNFARIQDQSERERALFLDVFFIEPDEKAYDDVLLVKSIRDNDRVFLETVLDEVPPPAANADEYFRRQEILYEVYGELKRVQGRWENMRPYFGLQPPLQPYARANRGYGHANFEKDFDGVYRRQPLVAKSSVLLEELRLDEITPDTPVDRTRYERLQWVDKHDIHHNVPYPLTPQVIRDLAEQMERRAPQKLVDTNNDGQPDDAYFVVRRYRDRFVPSITLSLALEYFNRTLDDIEVVLGSHILIPNPQYHDMEQDAWVPYRLTVKSSVYSEEGEELEPAQTRLLEQIRIPINGQGEMLVNYMGRPSFATPGGSQTFPVRSFSGYASTVTPADPAQWPRTRAVRNKILMVGPFAKGMAADEKPTPYGLMYGVEIHANALNTILMNNFLIAVPSWVDIAILAGLVLLIALMTSRLSTIWSLLVTIVLILALFIAISVIFEQSALIISFTTPALAMVLTFLTVVVYRVMTEEKDKRRIRDMFGKYVSPQVVDQILENPPELGGVDKELTVFFSDIRGYTSLSEALPPQELVNHLNLYLTAMTDIILEYRGTLDKYVGDEIMCFWGAPLPQPDHAILSCKCALRQMEKLRELNEGWPEDKRINIGIGVNSGIMTVGNMGSLGRMNYTLMGDGVNLGARLEGTNKAYYTNIIISENTYGLVRDLVVVRELDNIRVKGKNKPVLIYELVDVIGGIEPTPEPAGAGSKGEPAKRAAGVAAAAAG